MNVTLINYTRDAAAMLIFTKNTRLNMTVGVLEYIIDRCEADPAWMREQLAYMADTIPSSWEFVDYTFAVEGVSRAYTHQQVRTRAASYAQQSMRVVGMSEFDYVFTERNKASVNAMLIIGDVLAKIKSGYRALIEDGQSTEDARGILPTNIATNIVCKFNLRTMAELARSRSGGRTQGEYIAVVNAMIDEVLKVHPWAEAFLSPKGRDYFAEIEAFAEHEYGGDLIKKGQLLKIVDRMRKEI